jgi:hypothetical protein
MGNPIIGASSSSLKKQQVTGCRECLSVPFCLMVIIVEPEKMAARLL